MLIISIIMLIIMSFVFNAVYNYSGEIHETADDIYGSIGDAASPNEAMYSALSDGEIQVTDVRLYVCVLVMIESHAEQLNRLTWSFECGLVGTLEELSIRWVFGSAGRPLLRGPTGTYPLIHIL